jgi:uncharacterized protein (UPF0297 family)
MKGVPTMFQPKEENTIKFAIQDDKEQKIRSILSQVYSALKEKGYDPINQIVGYILSEDPTYITNYKNARSLICKVERDEILNALVRYYLR